MRYLLFHAQKFWYKTVKPALKRPPDPPGELSIDETVVVFVTVEAGDNDTVISSAVTDILDYATNKVKEKKIVVYPYAHLSNRLERPSRAHALLQKLVARLSENFDGQVYRAPFGWYKEFMIHVKGHPLSELSRSFEAATTLNLGNYTFASISDAISRGVIPDNVDIRPKLSGLASEKIEFLGVSCGRQESFYYTEKIIKFLRKYINGIDFRIVEINKAKDLWSTLVGYSRVLAYVPSIGASSCYLDYMVGLPSDIDVEEIFASMGIENVSMYSGVVTLYLYKSQSKNIMLGMKTDKGIAIGPIGTLITTAILHQAEKVKEGKTPMLPVWLHPYTVSIIPAREEHLRYAMSIATELSSKGANTIVLRPTIGIGARIRWSGKRWIPYTIVVGEQEMRSGTVTVRRRWRTGEQEVLTVPELVEEVTHILQSYGINGHISVLDIRG